jgi:Zn-dependent protease with chaperone function
MKRIALLVTTNLALVLLPAGLATLAGLAGVPMPSATGAAVALALATLLGFIGAPLSLLLSREAARRAIGVPTVGIFDSAQPNALAIGPSRHRALAGVSCALLPVTRDRDRHAPGCAAHWGTRG